MSYITKEVSCSKCGYTDRGPHLRILADPDDPPAFSAETQDENYPFLRLVRCPGQKKDDSCGCLLSPRLVFHPYAPRFREGDLCEIYAPMAYQYRNTPQEKEGSSYPPVGRLHGKMVMVVNPLPDSQNLVSVKLAEIGEDGRIQTRSTSFRKKTLNEIPVPQTALVPIKKEA